MYIVPIWKDCLYENCVSLLILSNYNLNSCPPLKVKISTVKLSRPPTIVLIYWIFVWQTIVSIIISFWIRIKFLKTRASRESCRAHTCICVNEHEFQIAKNEFTNRWNGAILSNLKISIQLSAIIVEMFTKQVANPEILWLFKKGATWLAKDTPKVGFGFAIYYNKLWSLIEIKRTTRQKAKDFILGTL